MWGNAVTKEHELPGVVLGWVNPEPGCRHLCCFQPRAAGWRLHGDAWRAWGQPWLPASLSPGR